jgi:hypothetical protein
MLEVEFRSQMPRPLKAADIFDPRRPRLGMRKAPLYSPPHCGHVGGGRTKEAEGKHFGQCKNANIFVTMSSILENQTYSTRRLLRPRNSAWQSTSTAFSSKDSPK